MSYRLWKTEEIEAVRHGYRTGRRAALIAQDLGRTRSAVSQMAHALGITKRYRPRTVADDG